MTRDGSTTKDPEIGVSTNEAVNGSATPPSPSLTPSAPFTSPSNPENNGSPQAYSGSQTQPFSQVIYPPPAFAYEVEDEEAEGVWGYLIPIDAKSGGYGTLTMKDRDTCIAKNGEACNEGTVASPKKCEEQEKDDENKKEQKLPSRGYLIGRHPECGKYNWYYSK
jgi:serine/threonine-protein kinase CHEK2